MHSSRIMLFSIMIIIFSFALLPIVQYSSVNAQVMLDTSCPSCVRISSEEISLYKELFPLIIWTDGIIYDHQSIITVNGYLRPENTFNPITITVTNHIGNLVAVEQITPNPNGDFTFQFNTASDLWQKDGSYIIKAQSGAENRSFKTDVMLTGGGIGQVAGCNNNQFSASGNCISYSISGATVNSASINPVEKSLLIYVTTDEGGGTITLNPSRDIINGISVVMLDDQESNTAAIQGNSITIMLPDGTEKIEIKGTFVIPEFGHLAILILTITITSIIIWSQKTNRSILLKS